MSGAPARAPLPAPDLTLLAALYVLEASAWLAVVASYGSGARALLAFPTGIVFLVACLATLAAFVIIVRRYRARPARRAASASPSPSISCPCSSSWPSARRPSG